MLCAPRWMRLLSKAWLPFVSVIEQSGIELDHSLDRAAAHCAELLAASEHDAIAFGSVISLRFVDRAFKSAYLARVLFRGEELDLPLAVLSEQRFHF